MLVFQAAVTLILGMVFLGQVVSLNIAKISELKIDVETNPLQGDSSVESIDLKQRYSAASYILLFVSLIELVIISRLLT